MRNACGWCLRWLARRRTLVARGRVGVLYSLTGALVALGCGVTALVMLPASGSGASTPAPSPNETATTIVRELPELRTETSDTYLRSDGTRVAKISRTPVNYRDGSGNWQPINTTLAPGANGGLAASATELPVALPSSLSSQVTVGSGGQTISFALEGAGGSASASGSSASYAEALPNVKASYEEQATRLKETLSLASASAPSVYQYHLSAIGGVSARLVDGAVVFSDAQGHPRYVMPPPAVADAGATGRPDAHDVHYTLSEDGSRLDVVVNTDWLQSAERTFPVTIDPTTEYWGDNVDCFIASEPSYENSSLCGWYFYLGYHPEGAAHSIGRALLRFELGSSIPQDSTILSANLRMTDSYTATSSQTIEVDGLEKTPTNSATWNKYDGTNAWTEKGGDYEKGSPSKQTIAPTGSGHVFSWGIASLVEKWVQTPSSNHGLIVKAENETSSGSESSWVSDSGQEHPYIEVDYSPKIGTPGDSTLLSQQLGDRQGLSVNVANGNVLMQNHILDLPGIGYDLSINQLYNNLEYSWRSAGMGSILSTGEDVRMELNEVEDTWSYADPSGAWWRFVREPAEDKEGKHAFKAPPALNAKLTEETDGSLVLEYVTARLKYYFNNNKHPSYLQKIEDANKNTTTMHYGAEGLSSIEDTHGHTVTFSHNKTSGYLASLKDTLGRKWEFTQNSKGQLETVKDPDLHKSKYTYNEADDLTQIEDPDGHLTELSYDSRFRITEIRHVVNGTATKAGTKDAITTLAYTFPATSTLECPSGTIGDTEVVSPDGSPEGKADSSSAGHKTFYCFNNQDQVTKTIDQAGNSSTSNYNASTGRLEAYSNPGQKAAGETVKTSLAYNPSGAVKEITEGTGSTTTLTTKLNFKEETANGKVEPSSMETPFSAAKQKEKQHTAFYGYDTAGNLSSVSQGGETGKPEAKLKHNEHGQLTESVDGDGHKTIYEYTSGNLTKITPESPLGKTELTYDTIGRVHSAKDGRGITATYSYDGEDRVTKVEYSDGSSVSFKFDADGNTTERVDAKSFGEPYTGVTSYEYDKLNRPTLETTPTAKSSTYGYDYDGNLTSLKDGGGIVTYGYGPDDVMTSAIEPENSSHPFKFAYEPKVDNRESVSFPNGILQCFKTDAVGRLTKMKAFKPSEGQNCSSSISPSSELLDDELFYTVEPKAGEVIDTPELQLLKNNKAGTQTVYSYDTLDRLEKAVTEPNGGGTASLTSEYEYDEAGNLKLNHTFSPTTTYSNNHDKYNAANEICAIATTTPSACATPSEAGIAGDPTYDEDGNMTSDGLLAGANKFAYTARDQLSSVTPHGGSATQIVSHATGQEDLAAIGTEEVIQNILGVGVTGGGESAKYYTRGSEGTLLAKRTAKGKPSESEYFLLDPFSSVTMLTSSAGAQTAPSSGSYQYDSYGNPIGTGPSTFGYGMGEILPSGLIHNSARYYDPALGQWTQPDPLNQATDLTQADRYTFAATDPVNSSDPTGKDACEIISAACHLVRSVIHKVLRPVVRKAGEFGLTDAAGAVTGCATVGSAYLDGGPYVAGVACLAGGYVGYEGGDTAGAEY